MKYLIDGTASWIINCCHFIKYDFIEKTILDNSREKENGLEAGYEKDSEGTA